MSCGSPPDAAAPAITAVWAAQPAPATAATLRLIPYDQNGVVTPLDLTIAAHATSAERGPRRPVRADAPFVSTTGRGGYVDAVRAVQRRIREGDVYQVNLAHHLRTSITGSPRDLFAAVCAEARPSYAAYAELADGRVVISASPELFLRYTAATRTLETRPMKGTRALAADRAEFEHAAKDRAELAMITDLMRNDLGRVAVPGSVVVTDPRRIEPLAAGQLQASSVIRATLREDRTLDDAIAAAFPPGSVTGAPKIAAMRLIDRLEPSPRGFYCGAIGLIDHASGDATYSVAIRTATLEPLGGGRWSITVPVGAGIVADSDPDAEWHETLLKARAFTSALRAAEIDA